MYSSKGSTLHFFNKVQSERLVRSFHQTDLQIILIADSSAHVAENVLKEASRSQLLVKKSSTTCIRCTVYYYTRLVHVRL